MTITRTEFLSYGIFGKGDSADPNVNFFTLEHAYQVIPDSGSASLNYAPKIPPGTYVCQRGFHQLAGIMQPFETFEVTNVPGHTDILFHSGNVNADSAGCILLGMDRNSEEILDSREAFSKFMQLNSGVDAFTLTIS